MKITCDECGNELTEPGALLFAPPEDDQCLKFHICTGCYYQLFDSHLMAIGREVGEPPQPQGPLMHWNGFSWQPMPIASTGANSLAGAAAVQEEPDRPAIHPDRYLSASRYDPSAGDWCKQCERYIDGCAHQRAELGEESSPLERED